MVVGKEHLKYFLDPEALQKSAMGRNRACSPDKELMPPPPTPQHLVASVRKGAPEVCKPPEPERKKLKGALLGIASVYGSDDSSDDEGSSGSPSSKISTSDSNSSRSYASAHVNKPLM